MYHPLLLEKIINFCEHNKIVPNNNSYKHNLYELLFSKMDEYQKNITFDKYINRNHCVVICLTILCVGIGYKILV